MSTAEFNPFDAEVMACPYPHLDRLRAEAPVIWSDAAGAFVVTSCVRVVSVRGRTVPPGRVARVGGEGNPEGSDAFRGR